MNETNAARSEALRRIAALADQHGLTREEILEHLGGGTESGRGERLLRRILAYLGAVFVLVGAVTAVNLFWADMGSAARVIASFGSGLVATILAIATLKDRRFSAASTPLFLVGALLQTGGLFVFLDETFTDGDAAVASMAIFGVMALQSVALFSWARRTDLAFLSVFFAFACLAAAFAWLDIDEGLSALVLGTSGLLVAWRIDATAYRGFVPLAYFVFGACVAFGAFDLVEGAFPLDFALVGIAAGLVYAGVLAHSRSLLVVGVVSMLCYLAYYTNEYFADMVSWPVALIILGLAMVGLSGYAVKLGRGMSA